MTKSDAIDSIPEIVEKAIPLIPPDYKCAAKTEAWMTNAIWRREQLAMRIKTMIIALEPMPGIGIDLSEFDFTKFQD